MVDDSLKSDGIVEPVGMVSVDGLKDDVPVDRVVVPEPRVVRGLFGWGLWRLCFAFFVFGFVVGVIVFANWG